MRVPDTHIGNWHVKLSNKSGSEETFLITAISTIGTTITETTDKCTTVNTGWECNVPANDEIEITLATSLEHICNINRVFVTVGAFVGGQDITVSNRRRLVKHRELSCPSITLANASYDTTTSSASWSVTVQRRLYETDPGINITFDDGVTFSALPDDCTASTNVVTCYVASFDNRSETFTATQKIAQTCTAKQHTVTANARFADDNAIYPVSPESGLNINIPALNPCVTPTPTHTPSPTPTPTDTPTPTPTPTHTPTPTPTDTPTPTNTPTPTHTPTPTPTPTPTDTPTPTPTHTPTPTPTDTPTPTHTPTPSPTPTQIPATLKVVFERLVGDDLTVSWMFDQTSVPEPTGYEFGWKYTYTMPGPPEKIVTSPETIVMSGPTTSEYTITDIEADVKYEIRVVAIYDDEERYVGRTALQLSSPREPKTESIETTETSIRLRWKDPILNTGFRHWPVDGYELSWGKSEVGTTRTTVALGADVREYRIDGLLPGTSYALSLFAKNGLGNSKAFNDSVMTDGSPPTPTPTPTLSPSPTATPTPTFTPTPTPTPDTRRVAVRFVELDGTNPVISWDLRQINQSDIESIKVSWFPTENEDSVMTKTLPTDALDYSIPDIEEKTLYVIIVEIALRGGARVSDRMNLLVDVPRPPSNVKLTKLSDTSIQVTWEYHQNPNDSAQRPVDEYEISWQKEGTETVSGIALLDSDVTKHRITGLAPGTTYKVTLRAYNGLDYGEAFSTSITTDGVAPTSTPTPTPTSSATPTATPTPSSTHTATPTPTGTLSPTPTPEMPPRAPLNLAVSQITSTSVRISWDPPITCPQNKCPFDGYRLNVVPKPSGWEDNEIKIDKDQTSYLIEGLDLSKEYEFALRAFNVLGDGEFGIPMPTPTPTPTSSPTGTPSPTPTSTVSPTASPKPTPTPTASPKPIPTPTASPKPIPTPTSTSSRSRRDTDPDPPEDVASVQGREAIVVYWDNPQWDGGSKILAYAVDWHPESPPFPLFLPPTERSTDIYGLKPGINYRIRVKAFNRRDDSLPETQRIKLTNTLIKNRSYDPFTGSISSGRATTLINEPELPGFEIHSIPKSLFWGDEMVISIQRHPPYEELIAELMSQQFNVVSDLFTVVASPHSRRSRFDSDAVSYRFLAPVVICITPNSLNAIPIHSYSIVQIVSPADIRVSDSAPVHEDDEIKICARIRELDVNRNVAFAVISHRLALQANADPTRHQGGMAGNATIALVMFVVGRL